MNRRQLMTAVPMGLIAAAGRTVRATTTASGDGALCLRYAGLVRDKIAAIRATEPPALLEAARAIARTRARGGTCFCQWETGHSFDGDMFPDRPGDTDLFVMGYTMGTPSVEPKAGDLLAINVLRKPLDDPRTKGLFVIGGPNPWCGDTSEAHLLTEANRALRIRPYADIWIDTHTTTRGALLDLPGATAPLGPTSGALGMVTVWPMVADAARILAGEGIAVTVRGDEPSLGADAPWVTPDRPLGGAYIDEVLNQIDAIGDELDTIRRIAAAATDRILAGGNLYVYSRHHEALSAEANAKRGGLALIKTTHAEDTAFAGTDRDFMIMGIYAPDDALDLAMLGSFRDRGMDVASIGPTTRAGAAPGGDTVPDSTDMHLGRMCDTYGLFAIPGLSRRVAPTSGIMVNLLFWSVIVQIADDIMRRTGATPAVLSTGALTGGADQRTASSETARTRGY